MVWYFMTHTLQELTPWFTARIFDCWTCIHLKPPIMLWCRMLTSWCWATCWSSSTSTSCSAKWIALNRFHLFMQYFSVFFLSSFFLFYLFSLSLTLCIFFLQINFTFFLSDSSTLNLSLILVNLCMFFFYFILTSCSANELCSTGFICFCSFFFLFSILSFFLYIFSDKYYLSFFHNLPYLTSH